MSGPLNALVTGPFAEAKEKVIRLPNGDAVYFKAILKHLYATPLDLGGFDYGFAVCADKWGLISVYNAYFDVICARTDIDCVEKFKMCCPIMTTLRLPSKMRKYIAKAFGMYIERFEEKLGMGAIWGMEFENNDKNENECDEKENLGDGKAKRRPSFDKPDEIMSVSQHSNNRILIEEEHNNIWKAFIFQGMLLDVCKYFGLFRHTYENGVDTQACDFDREFRKEHIASVLQKFDRYISDDDQRIIMNYIGCFSFLKPVSTTSTLKSKSQSRIPRHMATALDLMYKNGAMNLAPGVDLFRVSKFKGLYERMLYDDPRISVLVCEDGVEVRYEGLNITSELYRTDALKVRATLSPFGSVYMEHDQEFQSSKHYFDEEGGFGNIVFKLLDKETISKLTQVRPDAEECALIIRTDHFQDHFDDDGKVKPMFRTYVENAGFWRDFG